MKNRWGNFGYRKCGLQNAPFISNFSADWVTTQATFNMLYFWSSVQEPGHSVGQPCGIRGSLRSFTEPGTGCLTNLGARVWTERLFGEILEEIQGCKCFLENSWSLLASFFIYTIPMYHIEIGCTAGDGLELVSLKNKKTCPFRYTWRSRFSGVFSS